VNTTVNDLMGRSNVIQVGGTAQTANDNGADLNTLITQIGTAGAGLTNINLPNQTMNITGNITGNLSGSVGSVSGAVGSVTGAVGSVSGSVGSVAAAVTTDAASRTASKADVSALALEATVATLATAAALASVATDATLTRKIMQNQKEFDLDNSKMYIWNDADDAREYEIDLTDSDGAAVSATTEGPINASQWTAV